jgi:hypothetical protein
MRRVTSPRGPTAPLQLKTSAPKISRSSLVTTLESKAAESQRQLFDQLAEKLNIAKLDDWYDISAADVSNKGGLSILRRHQVLTNSYLII